MVRKGVKVGSLHQMMELCMTKGIAGLLSRRSHGS